MPLGCCAPSKGVRGAQEAEFMPRVSGQKDISCEEDSHLATVTGLSSFKNHVS